jgi:hypothetical protein
MLGSNLIQSLTGRTSMRGRTWVGLLGVVAVLLVLAARSEGPQRTEVGVTPELAGVWTTTATRYADRFLEIRPHEVVFGQGKEGTDRHRLTAVYLEQPEDGPPLYVLCYHLDGATEAMGELRVRIDQRVLRIHNLPQVAWTPRP